MSFKYELICLMLLSLSFETFAQTLPVFSFRNLPSVENDTSYWKIGGINTLTFSHVSLTNWAAGGNNSVSLNVNTGFFADHVKGRNVFENTLDMAYGLVKQGSKSFTKSDDKLNIVVKYGYQIHSDNKHWFFSSLIDFRTQFSNGFNATVNDSLISQFMSPGYLMGGIGVDYRPSPQWSFNYIPVSAKFTFVLNETLAQAGAYGVDSGRVTRKELGSFFRIKYKGELWENVNLESRLELFNNYLENFENIDVNWQTLFVLSVNKWLKVNFTSELIYDNDILVKKPKGPDGVSEWAGPEIQFKSVFGAGISVQFGDEKSK